MDDKALKLVLGSFKQKHPDAIDALRALTALQGTPHAAAAQRLLSTLLQVYDEGEQAKWQLRDLLSRMPRGDGTYYYAIKYNPSEMIYRIAVAGDMDMRNTKNTYFEIKPKPEIPDWKEQESGQ